jgi:hypothetical protein
VGWLRALTKDLINFVNWSRNKLISKSIDYLVIYTISQLDHPKMIKLRSPRALRRLRFMSHLFSVKPACFWLVVAFLVVLGGRLRPRCTFVPDFSIPQFDGPNNEITSTSMLTNGGGGAGGMPMVAAAAALLATWQQSKQRQQQQHDNNTTTNRTTTKTANMEGK